MWADSRSAGTAFTGVCAGAETVAAAGAERLARGRAVPAAVYTVAVATATWAVLGGRGLRGEAGALHTLLDSGDLPGSRERLTHLVGRDTRRLDEAEIVRAAVESVAENTSDAVVAPLLWGAVCGLPGLLGYRAVNTLDAMAGHRSARYERFGWASARLDDAANLVPARVTALLTALSAPLVGGSTRSSLAVAFRDGGSHPSPNAGYCEAAFAGALGVRLGGINVYGTRVEHRPVLGDGRAPSHADLRRAARLSLAVSVAAAAIAVVTSRVAALPRRPAGGTPATGPRAIGGPR